MSRDSAARLSCALIAAVLVTAACGSTVPSGQQGPGDAASTTQAQILGIPDSGGAAAPGTSPPSAGGLGGTSGGLAGTTGGSAQTAGTSSGGGGSVSIGKNIVGDVGITAKTIKVGVILTGGDPGAIAGLALGADDGYQRAARAMVDLINQTGGLAGRTVVPTFVTNDETDQSARNQDIIQAAICSALTEDDPVALVLSFVDATSSSAYGCYKNHGTPILDHFAPLSRSQMHGYRPYVLPPADAHLENNARILATGLIRAKFTTQRMAVIASDSPGPYSAVEKTLIPLLEAGGGKVIDKEYFPDSYEGGAASMNGAVLRFKAQNVDRVVFLTGGAGAMYLFSNQAASQNYQPRYGISSSTRPNGLATVYTQAGISDQLVGSVASSWNYIDVGSYEPPHSRAAECYREINKRAGTTYPKNGDVNTSYAAWMCESWWLTQLAARPRTAKTLLRRDFYELFTKLGSSYRPVNIARALFSPARYDGVVAYRILTFDKGCGCYRPRTPFMDAP